MTTTKITPKQLERLGFENDGPVALNQVLVHQVDFVRQGVEWCEPDDKVGIDRLSSYADDEYRLFFCTVSHSGENEIDGEVAYVVAAPYDE